MQSPLGKAAIIAGALLVTSLGLSAQDDLNNPTGRGGLLLIDKRGNHIRFFDPTTLKELSNFSTGNKAPHDFAISPDHRTAYIPIYGDGIIRRNPNPGNVILVVDLASQKLRETIDISPYQAPHGIQVDANGMLYVVCDISQKLLVVNPETRKVEAAIDVEGTGHWLALLPDATRAYVSHQGGGDFISIVDLKARKMVGRIPAPGGTVGITASPDGRRVFAMSSGRTPPATVLVVDTATNSIVDRVALQGHSEPGYKLRVSLDGTMLITSAYAGAGESFINLLRTSDLQGSQRVVKAGRAPMGFAFAPDSRTALVANDGDGTVTVVDLQQGIVTNTFKGGTGIETLSYY
jgi:DNA-binding beta-propeller fold protein YncE